MQTAYWDSISWFNVLRGSLEDVAFAAQQLVAADQSATAVDLLASTYGAIPVDVVIQVLEAFRTDVTRDLAGDEKLSVSGHDLAQLFDSLDQSPDLSEGVIAKLEIPFVGRIHHCVKLRKGYLFAHLTSR